MPATEKSHALDHVVVVLFENRSLDNVLGSLYGPEDGKNLVASLTVSVANVNSPVVGIPTPIARYLAGRRFQAKTQDATPAGVIAIHEEGTSSWGYGPFLRRRGAEPGGALTAWFDLANEMGTLSLGDETAFIDEAS